MTPSLRLLNTFVGLDQSSPSPHPPLAVSYLPFASHIYRDEGSSFVVGIGHCSLCSRSHPTRREQYSSCHLHYFHNDNGMPSDYHVNFGKILSVKSPQVPIAHFSAGSESWAWLIIVSGRDNCDCHLDNAFNFDSH